MSLQNPEVGAGLDNFSDVIGEGERFYLEGIRVVHVRNTKFGDRDMAILKVRGHEKELGLWGSYIVAQANSAQPSDLNQWYVLNMRVVEGFGKEGRPVKVLDPATREAESFGDKPDF